MGSGLAHVAGINRPEEVPVMTPTEEALAAIVVSTDRNDLERIKAAANDRLKQLIAVNGYPSDIAWAVK